MAIKKKSAAPASAKKAKASTKVSDKASAKAAPSVKLSPELVLIQSMAGILNDTGLTEIELEQRGVRVRVSRAVTTVSSTVSASAPAAHHAPAPNALTPHAPAAAPQVEAEPQGEVVKSPMVGTVYLAPSPGAQPFIEVGAPVKQGQTLLIIEAMKTMNQIKSPVSGKVVKLLVDNGSPVEFGASLVVIE